MYIVCLVYMLGSQAMQLIKSQAQLCGCRRYVGNSLTEGMHQYVIFGIVIHLQRIPVHTLIRSQELRGIFALTLVIVADVQGRLAQDTRNQ